MVKIKFIANIFSIICVEIVNILTKYPHTLLTISTRIKIRKWIRLGYISHNPLFNLKIK